MKEKTTEESERMKREEREVLKRLREKYVYLGVSKPEDKDIPEGSVAKRILSASQDGRIVNFNPPMWAVTKAKAKAASTSTAPPEDKAKVARTPRAKREERQISIGNPEDTKQVRLLRIGEIKKGQETKINELWDAQPDKIITAKTLAPLLVTNQDKMEVARYFIKRALDRGDAEFV